MNTDINLLGKKKKHIGGFQYSKLRLLRLVAVSLLFVVATFSVIIFLLIALSPLPQLKKQEEQALFTLSQFHQDMGKVAYVNERTDAITKLLSQRKQFDKKLDAIQTQIPEGVTVDALSVTANNMSLTVSSNSVEQIDIFINNLLRAVQEKRDFSKVTLTSLSIDNQRNLFIFTVALVTL